MIYRVTVKTTGSLQPSATFWQSKVVYCGVSLADARIAYLTHRPTDYWCGYGNRVKETVIEEFEEEPEEIDSEEGDMVEVVEEE
jgi:hypothetical protein